MHPTVARFGDGAFLWYLVGEENSHEDDLIDIVYIRILVVDDEEMIRALLSELFGADLYEVTTAVGGEQELEMLNAKRIDADRPVVIMSGHIPAETVSWLTSLGADDYMAKPFETWGSSRN